MRRCCLVVCLLVGLYCSLSPSPAKAFDLLAWLGGNNESHTAEYLSGAEPDTVALQAPARILLLTPDYDQIPGVPSYPWGYFGAARHSTSFWHEGYRGDCSWWSLRTR